jgi:hypothetical protein
MVSNFTVLKGIKVIMLQNDLYILSRAVIIKTKLCMFVNKLISSY